MTHHQTIDPLVLFIVFLLVFYLLKAMFSLKKKEIVKNNKRKEAKEISLFTPYLFVWPLLIVLAYGFGGKILQYIQGFILYFSKKPVLFENGVQYAWVAGILLSFCIGYLLYSHSLSKTYGKDLKSYLSTGNPYGINAYQLYAALNALFLILTIIFSIGLIWSFDNYLIANDDAIYYNSLKDFGKVSAYGWNDVDKIIYTTATIGRDGNMYGVNSPYYSILIKDGTELFLEEDAEVVGSWINMIEEKSGAEIYIKYGATLTKKGLEIEK